MFDFQFILAGLAKIKLILNLNTTVITKQNNAKTTFHYKRP